MFGKKLFGDSASQNQIAMEGYSGRSPDSGYDVIDFYDAASMAHEAFSTLAEFAGHYKNLNNIATGIQEHLRDYGTPNPISLESFASSLRAIQADLCIEEFSPYRYRYSVEEISSTKLTPATAGKMAKADAVNRCLIMANTCFESAAETAKDLITKLIEWFKSAYANAMQLFAKGKQAYNSLQEEVNVTYNTEAGKKQGANKDASLKLISAGRVYNDKTEAALNKLKARMSSFRVGDMNDEARDMYKTFSGVVRDVMGVYRKKSSEIFKLVKAGINDVKKDVTTESDLAGKMTKHLENLSKTSSGLVAAVEGFCKAKTNEELINAKNEIDTLLGGEQ